MEKIKIPEKRKMKIVPVFLQYHYGRKSWGKGVEYYGIYLALKQITDEVYPFWFDDYLTKKDELQKQVIKFIDEVNPDIVFFVLMRDEFSFETLDYLKGKYTTVNWFADDQWRFEDFTKYYAPHFTYSITTDKFALSKYKEIGYKNVILSQWASCKYSENVDFETIKYKYDVSFVGGINGNRRWIINQLKRKGIKVECFGAGWENGRVSLEEMCEIFKTSKINLNILDSISYDIRYIFSSIRTLREFIKSKKRVVHLNARDFEILSSGGFALSNYNPSLGDHFEIGRELAAYSGIDDLILQINYYLNNEEERRKIMINGYKKAMKEGTFLNRLKNIFEKIEVKL